MSAPKRCGEKTVREESMGEGCKRRQVILITYRHGAEVTVTIGLLKTETGEEEYVQVMKSLINVLPWRMCVTA